MFIACSGTSAILVFDNASTLDGDVVLATLEARLVRNLAREHGTRFALVTPSRAVLQVLELARLDSIFEVR